MKLSHLAGDCGHHHSGNTHDVFAVSEDDGIHIAYIRFNYPSAGEGFSVVLPKFSGSQAMKMSGCSAELHFISSVTHAVMKGFKDEHAFYFEQFYDKDGKDLPRDFELLPL